MSVHTREFEVGNQHVDGYLSSDNPPKRPPVVVRNTRRRPELFSVCRGVIVLVVGYGRNGFSVHALSPKPNQVHRTDIRQPSAGTSIAPTRNSGDGDAVAPWRVRRGRRDRAAPSLRRHSLAIRNRARPEPRSAPAEPAIRRSSEGRPGHPSLPKALSPGKIRATAARYRARAPR